jgi:hypothetical protein
MNKQSVGGQIFQHPSSQNAKSEERRRPAAQAEPTVKKGYQGNARLNPGLKEQMPNHQP